MTTPTQELREQVARIVDPEAWDEISAEDNQDGADIFADAWELALAKADAILALPPPSPVKEAVAEASALVAPYITGAKHVRIRVVTLRRVLAENARLTKLVEEAGEALEPFAEVCERFQLKASDSPHALYGLPADYWLRASLTHKAITGGGEKPEPTAKLHPDFRRGVCTQCGEPKTPYCRCDEDWFFDMDGKP